VVRLYELHDEAYYVVRRADGRPLAVPVWMTRPEAAYARVVSAARLPLRVLLELRRVSVLHKNALDERSVFLQNGGKREL
jgi:hypothetical protein